MLCYFIYDFIMMSILLLFRCKFLNVLILKIQTRSIKQSLQDFFEPINGSNSKIPRRKALILEWQ